MPTDLWYFYESDLNKGTLVDFANSLPDRIKPIFRDSMGGISYLDKDAANVVQGYRGPHNNGDSGDGQYLGPCNGLQEVRFWWGVSKHLNWVPGIGTVVFGIARAVSDTEWHSIYFDSKTEECLSHNKNHATDKLNDKGHQLFQEGKYAEAEEYFNNAYLACSSGYSNESSFKSNMDKAKAEQEAIKLNAEGDRFFNQGKFNEAKTKYQEAYNKSQISSEYEKYKTNMGKVDSEFAAIQYNSQGDFLFSQGKYEEARDQYLEAYLKSQYSANYTKYKSNRESATSEVKARQLNNQGDSLFSQGKYSTAKNKYEQAYNESRVTKEKKVYESNKNKIQNIIQGLEILENSWNTAWIAENDETNDRSEEAKNLFQKVLNESKKNLQKYPTVQCFKQYETFVSLKIEGNELFNQGVELQQSGIELLKAAEELKEEHKFELASQKLIEAKNKFVSAQSKFEKGIERDKRFESCVEFVQEHLNKITELLDVINDQDDIFGFGGLNINKRTQVQAEKTVNTCNYTAQI